MRPIEKPTWGGYARRGLMYGAALGMLAGLFLTPGIADDVARIVAWRNVILGGAAIGLLAGLVFAATRRAEDEPEAMEPPAEPPTHQTRRPTPGR